jgi:hypothetical protein
MVEVLGRYLNPCEQGERLKTLLEIVPQGARKPKTRTKKQRQRRLTAKQTEELVAAYQAGIGVVDLAKLFNLHRYTVSKHLTRRGVERRPTSKLVGHVEEAKRLYKAGWSLEKVGDKFGVNASIVGWNLRKMGVKMRDSHGRGQ